MSINQIQTVLDTEFIDLMTVNSIDYRLGNERVEANDNYCMAFLLPADKTYMGMTSVERARYDLIYQISIYQKKGTGNKFTRDTQDLVLARFGFTDTFDLGRLKVQKSWVSAPIEYDPTYIMTPVSVELTGIY